MQTEAAKKVVWDELTRLEIEAAARADAVVILPIGATEQHGPHLPLNVDTIAVFDVAMRAANQIADFPVLVMPALRWGFSPMHMSFAGAISLSWQTMGALVTEICTCIHSHGFRKIFILNGHGGNAGLLRTLVIGLNEQGIEVATATYFELLSKEVVDSLLDADDRITHAGEFETSTTLFLRPDLVDHTKIDPSLGSSSNGYYSRRRFGSVLIGRNFAVEAPLGTLGFGHTSAAEKGEKALAASARVFAEFLREWGRERR